MRWTICFFNVFSIFIIVPKLNAKVINPIQSSPNGGNSQSSPNEGNSQSSPNEGNSPDFTNAGEVSTLVLRSNSSVKSPRTSMVNFVLQPQSFFPILTNATSGNVSDPILSNLTQNLINSIQISPIETNQNQKIENLKFTKDNQNKNVDINNENGLKIAEQKTNMLELNETNLSTTRDKSLENIQNISEKLKSEKKEANTDKNWSNSSIERQKKAINMSDSDAPLITELNAVPPSSPNRPIIRLETAMKNAISAYLSLRAKHANHQNPSLRYTNRGMRRHEKGEKFDDVLGIKQIRSIFKLARRSETSPITRCRIPEALISIKCFGNMGRITLLSDSETRLRAELIGPKAESVISIRSYKRNAFLIWNARNGSVSPSLVRRVSLGMLKTSSCNECAPLHTQLVLKNDEYACIISVDCGRPGSETVAFHPLLKPTSVVAAAISLQDSGPLQEIVTKVTSGDKAVVHIRASSSALFPGLFVKECFIREENQSPLAVISNGCATSKMIEQFKVSKDTSAASNSYVISASITAFTSRINGTNMTLGCNVMICNGYCDIHSSCQSVYFSHSDIKNSHRIGEVYLETSFQVFPESSTNQIRYKDGKPKPYEVPQERIARNHDNRNALKCTSSSNTMTNFVCYSYLAIICCIFSIILISIITYNRYTRSPYKWRKFDDEIESPPRTLFMDESATRKRSPPNRSNLLYLPH